MKIEFFVVLSLVIGALLLKGENFAMSDTNSTFQLSYRDLFKDVDKLNKYTRSNNVKLMNVEVSGVSLYGAEFHGASFNKVKWEDAALENCIFDRVVFENCEFENTNFNGATFRDCVFRKCKIVYTKLNRANCKNVEFVECDIQNSGMNKWHGEGLVFTHSKILDTPIAQGKIELSFRNTDMDGVQVVLAEGMLPLTVENCLLSEVDFGDSKFSNVILRRVKQGEGPVRFNGSTGKSFRFEEVEMNRGVSLAGVKAESAFINGSQIRVTFRGSDIKKITVRDSQTVNFSVRKSNLPHVELVNSYIYDPMICEGTLGELIIQNSTLEQADFDSLKADYVLFHNIIMKGKIDFTNAVVKNFKAQEIKRDPSLQLITTGSNIKLQ